VRPVVISTGRLTGLYQSVAVEDPTDTEELSVAIKRVWGSLWDSVAKAERELSGVKKGVAMAVLVQPNLRRYKERHRREKRE